MHLAPRYLPGINRFALAMFLFFATSSVGAQSTTIPSSADLDSTDAAVSNAAFQALISAFDTDPRRAGATLVRSRRLLDRLMEQKKYVLVAELSLAGLQSQMGTVDRIEYFLTYRIRALLLLQRKDEALQAAKSLYNVSSLASANKTILLVAETLTGPSPAERGAAARFQLQQFSGATAEALKSSLDLGAPVLEKVVINPAIYDGPESLAEPHGNWGEFGEGNRLLLADKPDDALAIFKRLESSPPTPAVAAAAKEGVARAQKAKYQRYREAIAYVGT